MAHKTVETYENGVLVDTETVEVPEWEESHHRNVQTISESLPALEEADDKWKKLSEEERAEASRLAVRVTAALGRIYLGTHR